MSKDKHWLRKLLFVNDDRNALQELGIFFIFLIVLPFLLWLVILVSSLDFPNSLKTLREHGGLCSLGGFFVKLAWNYLSEVKNSLDRKLNEFKESYENDTKELKCSIVRDLKRFEENYEKYMRKAQITFESGINEFDDKHLRALRRVLDELDKVREEGECNVNIFAIDNSDSRTWWSDTMIGYLALLSRHHPESSIHRIFVCQKNELLSPIFAKTIGLHSLMGFRTYVIVYDKYKEVLKTIKTSSYDIEREVFIWTKTANESNPQQQLGATFEININANDLHFQRNWLNARCYQSFWKSDCNYNSRQDFPTENLTGYYGNTILREKVEIKFEFIANEKSGIGATICPEKAVAWDELPKQYLDLITQLLQKMICCKDENEVVIDNNYFGIEVRTVKNCGTSIACQVSCPYKSKEHFDATTMSNVKSILQKYYNKLS